MDKKKTVTSTAVKARYNSKVYDVISVRVPKELAATFKAKCTETGIPQAQVLKEAMSTFVEEYQEDRKTD